MCNLVKDKDYTYAFNKRARSPYIYGAKDQWFSLEDQSSMYSKARYARENNLGGIMIFDLHSDDYKVIFKIFLWWNGNILLHNKYF